MKYVIARFLTTLAVLALAVGVAGLASAGDADVSKSHMAFDEPPAAGAKAKCPVTKKEFTVDDKTVRSEHGGKHYAFCCPGCKPKFDEDPESFLKGDGDHAAHHGDHAAHHGDHAAHHADHHR